jgi:uncharacterized SAM-binding protein YcdF (DUF218 family)
MKLRWRVLWRIVRVVLLIWLVIVSVLVGLIHHYGTTDAAQTADVIVVLGAGVTRNGNPGSALYRRTMHAGELWQQNKAPYILCTGAQAPNRPNSEAEACRNTLLQHGVPAAAILMETNSRSTEENAIYARDMLQARGWHNAILVTDSYHMFRATLIFTSRGVDVQSSPVPNGQIRDRIFYLASIGREVVALHWQLFKDALNLPVTQVTGV